MREECQHLKGRKRDLCEGRGLDGRQNPLQSASDDFRASIGLEPITVAEPQAKQIVPRQSRISAPQVSKIGTRLANIFRDTWGAIPCGNCKEAIAELNGMTVDEVQSRRFELVKAITSNAANAAPAYWQKIMIAADQFLHIGGTEYVIGQHLDKACELERSSAK